MNKSSIFVISLMASRIVKVFPLLSIGLRFWSVSHILILSIMESDIGKYSWRFSASVILAPDLIAGTNA